MNPTKLQVQMLKDGKRTVIIVNGASAEQDELVYKIVSAYYASGLGMEVAVPETEDRLDSEEENLLFEEVKGLTPPPEPKHEVPTDEEVGDMEPYHIARSRNQHLISQGEYANMTALEALHQDNELALVRLHKYATGMKDSAEKDEIISTCKQYMVSLPAKTREFFTRERKCRFAKTIADMATISPFISGYMDLNSFEMYASDEEINNTVINLAAALCERGSK